MPRKYAVRDDANAKAPPGDSISHGRNIEWMAQGRRLLACPDRERQRVRLSTMFIRPFSWQMCPVGRRRRRQIYNLLVIFPYGVECRMVPARNVCVGDL